MHKKYRDGHYGLGRDVEASVFSLSLIDKSIRIYNLALVPQFSTEHIVE